MSFRVVCSAMVMCLALSGAAFAQSPALTTTEAMIPSSDPGVKLYIRNKHAEGMTSFSPDKTLLFVHGATYPADSSFDLPIDGVSMMDLFAQNGFDVYLVDVRLVWALDPSAGNGSASRGEQADCDFARGGRRSRRRGRLYSGSARHPETRPHGLVVGHVDRRRLYGATTMTRGRALAAAALSQGGPGTCGGSGTTRGAGSAGPPAGSCSPSAPVVAGIPSRPRSRRIAARTSGPGPRSGSGMTPP